MLHELGIHLPYEGGCSKVKNNFEDSVYYSICNDYGTDADEVFLMYGNWFYTKDYAVFGHEIKATERSLPDDHTRLIVTQSRGFTNKYIEKISRSVRAYVYLVATSKVQAR